jgi:hypothetical protein
VGQADLSHALSSLTLAIRLAALAILVLVLAAFAALLPLARWPLLVLARLTLFALRLAAVVLTFLWHRSLSHQIPESRSGHGQRRGIRERSGSQR